MSTVTSNRVHAYNSADRWPPKTMVNRRRTSTNPVSVLGDNWPRDVHPNSLRHSNINVYKTSNSEHDIKYPAPRTSEEAMMDDEEANADKNNHKDQSNLRRKHQQVDDYQKVEIPDPTIAMQRLQRLKELQRRKDIADRYFSQEIRKLIDEHRLSSRMAFPPWKINERLDGSSLQFYAGDRSRNLLRNLEPCGTMMTITQLDCGCIQETTRPIFTTIKGRVQKKACNPTQDEMILNMSATCPQEHLYCSMEPQKNKNSIVKPKKRFSWDPNIYAKSTIEDNRDMEMRNNQRNETQKSDAFDRIPRNASPRRKFSDTSTTSV